MSAFCVRLVCPDPTTPYDHGNVKIVQLVDLRPEMNVEVAGRPLCLKSTMTGP